MANAALSVDQIPQCLRDREQWVCWKSIARDGKRTKKPIDAKTGLPASATDARTWSPFPTAYRAYRHNAGITGVGYVFAADDPFAGVDMDNCLDAAGNFTWGREIVESLATYTEVSPSGRGVKLFLRASKPAFAKCRRDGFGPDGQGGLELYDRARFFVVTGRTLPDAPTEVASRQTELEALCRRLWPAQDAGVPQSREAAPRSDAVAHCLQAMLAMRLVDHNDGSYRLFSACCRCVEHDLSDADALACLRAYEQQQPFPTRWTDAEILRRLRDAERHGQRGVALALVTKRVTPACKSVGQLLADYPQLRQPVIHGLLRVGESMNVIAPSKTGKSWMVTDLALTVATGRAWLETFATEPGNVLVLDNELHAETSASRIPKVALARNIGLHEIAETVFIDNLRGRLSDIFSLQPYFQALQPGYFKIIILDAFYRFLPKDADENSNANLTDIYNQLDSYAATLGCSFVLVHHASKGDQSGKSITDVGAGAGSQARATDTHLILRPHQEPGAVVLDAAVRSWPPLASRCLRWTFPVWTPDDGLDPTALRTQRTKRRAQSTANAPPTAPAWTPERLADELASETPIATQALLDAAVESGVSMRRARLLLRQAEAAGLVHRWSYGSNRPVEYATVPQEVISSQAG